ncbi:hypothetical protein ACFYZ9_33475 [Streptomyces sp. NPDC001691]|uniref:hypothetical protein n=1 Tax=Streptomyces sp. NPDC001691 TaxID=3364600 RepID=UPI003685B3B3
MTWRTPGTAALRGQAGYAPPRSAASRHVTALGYGIAVKGVPLARRAYVRLR